MIKKYIKPDTMVLDSSLMRKLMFDVNTSNTEEVEEGEVGTKERTDWQEEPVIQNENDQPANYLW